ncbi:hypothetical protein EYZ11_001154 [Aspergillus tanneri]|uniref:CCHC-type domain-containing protein n=1 Tax=Aspergillus tanneri TaxID=1220188 RepID=A0A4S3JV88_9EURO|nr:hypothetical protein EYZ11_001154 [Aspergillus tanneri]
MSGWTPDEGDWGVHSDSGFRNNENVSPNSFKGAPDFGGDDFGNDFDGNDSKPTGEQDDNKCRNCGNDGHFARNCPEPRKGMACFNCGEEGHTKSKCIKPRVFKGSCRICNQEGHPAAECPEKPASVCKNCKMEGHLTMECKSNRKFDMNHIPDKLPDEAWNAIKAASAERNLEDFREALNMYSKAVPQATFLDIEKKLREDNLCFYIIAMDKQVDECISLINLQGKLNCKYVVGFFYRPKPQRAHLRERWPESVEDNFERLENAGLPYDRQIPKCGNCGEMGHTTRGCKEERALVERIEVKCVNCNAVGHRARDCTETRRDPYACRNCGSNEHKAADCPNPRTAEGVECRRCNEVGHFAKDCPQASAPRACRNCGSEDHMARNCDKPRDVSTVTCRNCDEVGHFSRDCPRKKDWSKVKCNNCGEMGHTIKRCPSAAEPDGMATDNSNDDFTTGGWPVDRTESKGEAQAGGGGWASEGATWG